MDKISTLQNLLETESEGSKEVKRFDEGPSDLTIQFILNYSKALEVKKGKLIQNVSITLN